MYSRITGYYRPVQNWNDGKLQEYSNRVVYDTENSILKKPISSIVTLSATGSGSDVEVRPATSVTYLFTTKTCPNCRIAKEALKDIPYILIDAEENAELVAKYGVMQAPTLVVAQGDSFKKYANASNIKKFAESVKTEAQEHMMV